MIVGWDAGDWRLLDPPPLMRALIIRLSIPPFSIIQSIIQFAQTATRVAKFVNMLCFNGAIRKVLKPLLAILLRVIV